MAVSQVAGPRFRDCGPFMGRASRILPAALFANGEQGTWYEPGPDTCFQDDAGTTPADEGDPIGYLTDLSGNGNHATQSTAARRPTLQQTAGGLWYLDFDGVDDGLSSGTSDFMSGVAASSVIGVRRSSGDVLTYRNDGSGIDDYTYRIWGLGGVQHRIYQAGGTSTPLGIGDISSDSVVTVNGSGANWSTRLNGANVASRSTGQDLDFDAQNVGQRIRLGFNGTSDSMAGRIYGAIFLNRQMTASEIASVEAYMAQRLGVTL